MGYGCKWSMASLYFDVTCVVVLQCTELLILLLHYTPNFKQCYCTIPCGFWESCKNEKHC